MVDIYGPSYTSDINLGVYPRVIPNTPTPHLEGSGILLERYIHLPHLGTDKIQPSVSTLDEYT